MDTPGSIEWLDPAPRLHIDDCFEIRSCRLGPCDLLLSSHQNLRLEVRLRHCFYGHGDDMKDSNLSQGACVRENEDTTTRRSVDVVASVPIVNCHASIDVVIDVRIVDCHANINVVIAIHVVLCHPLVDFPLFLRA